MNVLEKKIINHLKKQLSEIEIGDLFMTLRKELGEDQKSLNKAHKILYESYEKLTDVVDWVEVLIEHSNLLKDKDETEEEDD